MLRLQPRLVLTALLAALAGAAPAAAAPAITEYSAGLPAGAGPFAVAAPAGGDVWFVDDVKPGALGRITTAGAITEYTAGLTKDAQYGDLAAGPGGAWFTETSKNKIGRVTAAGAITEFSGSNHDKPTGIAAGPDGNLWYTAVGKGGAIVRMSPAGATREFTTGLTPSSAPQDIALGADGNLWFTEAAAGRIGRITPQGAITEYLAGAGAGTPQDIAAGPDGNLWFTVNGSAPAIGRITTSGVITLFTAGLPLGSAPEGIVGGADGNLHYTDPGANAIGIVTPAGTITTTSAGLSAAAGLRGIAAGPDGAVWFAEHDAGALGRSTVAPGAVDVSAADVTSSAGTLTGTVTPNGEATTAYIEWGPTSAYGSQSTPAAVGSGAAAQTFDVPVTGLSPSVVYHARVVATNPAGTSYGPDRTFTTTAPGAPSATTRPATGVTAAQATLNATVNPEGSTTIYRFEWGTTTGYGSTLLPAGPTVGSDAADHALADALTGLAPNTAYHFRVVADGNGHTTVGADQTFRTDAVAPEATAAPAGDVTTTGAVLHGVVVPRNSATTFRFEWGTTTDYTGAAPDPDELVAGDDAPHPVALPLTGLAPDTTYHYRLVATSNTGATASPDATFRTAAPALPADPPPAPGDPAPADRSVPPAPLPQYGMSVAATPTRGTIRVRRPGGALTVLDGGDAIPTGSTVDATRGELRLTSALEAAGRTQTARVHGAVFRVRQPRAAEGMVYFDLRSPATGCATARAAVAASARRRKPRPGRTLWAKDDHGRYTTSGRGATATVRGTEWTVTETCAGTLTRVVHGAVRVFDHGRRRAVTVRRGGRYLARVRR